MFENFASEVLLSSRNLHCKFDNWQLLVGKINMTIGSILTQGPNRHFSVPMSNRSCSYIMINRIASLSETALI